MVGVLAGEMKLHPKPEFILAFAKNLGYSFTNGKEK
jgi:hypothetical protein